MTGSPPAKARAVSRRLPAAAGRYVVAQGSIALDGVSLTVGQKPAANRCVIYLIPETMMRTTLGGSRGGDLLNVEVDYLAKLVGQAASRHP